MVFALRKVNFAGRLFSVAFSCFFQLFLKTNFLFANKKIEHFLLRVGTSAELWIGQKCNICFIYWGLGGKEKCTMIVESLTNNHMFFFTICIDPFTHWITSIVVTFAKAIFWWNSMECGVPWNKGYTIFVRVFRFIIYFCANFVLMNGTRIFLNNLCTNRNDRRASRKVKTDFTKKYMSPEK